MAYDSKLRRGLEALAREFRVTLEMGARHYKFRAPDGRIVAVCSVTPRSDPAVILRTQRGYLSKAVK